MKDYHPNLNTLAWGGIGGSHRIGECSMRTDCRQELADEPAVMKEDALTIDRNLSRRAQRIEAEKDSHFVWLLAAEPIPALTWIAQHIVNLPSILRSNSIRSDKISFRQCSRVAKSQRRIFDRSRQWSPNASSVSRPCERGMGGHT